MNSITELLNLEDLDITVSDVRIEGTKKFVTLESPITTHFCPICGFKMHSRGIKTRTISHPMMQDKYELVLLLKQRRWRCINPECRYETNDSFRFVSKSRRSTNATDMLIVLAFRDLSLTATAIANRFHTSDTHVLDIFDRYVKLDRLPLSDIISVDEVYIDMDAYCKYALVIQDFYTGDPIDILRSRRDNVTEPYFRNIPLEERYKVKYLLSDMYNPYICYVEKYFPNAVSVVDSFHVIQWMVHAIDKYMRELLRKFKQRDQAREDALSQEQHRIITLPESDEVYLLRKYKWLVLASQSNISYHSEPRMDHHFRRLMNTYDYERALLRIDPRLYDLRSLKELYIAFNSRCAGNPIEARIELDELISYYQSCNEPIFQDFSELLIRFHDYIINSFVMVEKYGNGEIYSARLSNGPIESLNRKVKDLKRQCRGFRNFEHMRNRFLYATRNNTALNAVSDSSQVQYYEEDDLL